MSLPSLPLAYLGPESFLPMTSVLATVVGFFLMFGQNTLRFVARCCRSLLKRRARSTGYPTPHFPIERREPTEVSRR